MASTTTTTATATTHPFTCNTCQVAFRGSELQRGHMQSDWHRYNLKRRVASLPPLTSEIFAEKVLANQASAAATAARASFERVCPPCQRTYFSENAYQNHLGSAKHRAKLASLQAGSVTATEDDGAESMTGSTFSLGEPTSIVRRGVADDSASEVDVISVADSTDQASTADDSASTTTSTESTNSAPTTTKCLFCNATSPTLEENVTHMEKTHNLFIPERAYLVDLAGLVAHLSERVFELHECLYCGQMRHSTVGVQTHMRDKGHCMIAFESEEEMVEVGEFYDFTSTYSDDEEDDTDANDDNDEEWEDADDADDASDASDATETDPTTARAPRPATDRAYASAYELHLPSGRTAGHRSLARYFRQNLHNYPSPAERMAQLAIADEAAAAAADEADNGRGRQVVSRANGGTGMLGVSDLRKKEVVREEVRERRRAERREGRVQWGKDRVGNSQKHYRDPLLQ